MEGISTIQRSLSIGPTGMTSTGLVFKCRGDANQLDANNTDSINPLFANIGWGMFEKHVSALSIKEKRTGVEFPGEFCYRQGQRNCPRITGAGVRTKKIAGIKSLDIYALSLYVDESSSKTQLRRLLTASKTPEAIATHPDLFKILLDAYDLEKSLVLVITSGLVKRKNFLEALNDRLAPPMTKANELKSLDKFKAQFDDVEFKKGLEISFTFSNGKLITKADGRVLNTLSNKCLSDTLLDIYLGSDPVSPSAKKEFSLGLARMITS